MRNGSFRVEVFYIKNCFPIYKYNCVRLRSIKIQNHSIVYKYGLLGGNFVIAIPCLGGKYSVYNP